MEEHRLDPNETFWWIDYFCLRQSVDDDFSPDEVETVIKDIGHTVVLAMPWSDPTVLRRIWCLYEIYCTVKQGAKLQVHVVEGEKCAFLEALTSDYGSIMATFCSIDVLQSQASDPEDREKILRLITDMPGGA